jgi:hypothetical protein
MAEQLSNFGVAVNINIKYIEENVDKCKTSKLLCSWALDQPDGPRLCFDSRGIGLVVCLGSFPTLTPTALVSQHVTIFHQQSEE